MHNIINDLNRLYNLNIENKLNKTVFSTKNFNIQVYKKDWYLSRNEVRERLPELTVPNWVYYLAYNYSVKFLYGKEIVTRYSFTGILILDHIIWYNFCA